MVTYTYDQQRDGYEYLKTLDIGYSFYTGPYTEKISALLDPTVKTIVHIPSVNSRESLKDKHREAEDIMNHLGDWQGIDPETGFHLIKTAAGNVIKVADRSKERRVGKECDSRIRYRGAPDTKKK